MSSWPGRNSSRLCFRNGRNSPHFGRVGLLLANHVHDGLEVLADQHAQMRLLKNVRDLWTHGVLIVMAIDDANSEVDHPKCHVDLLQHRIVSKVDDGVVLRF